MAGASSLVSHGTAAGAPQLAVQASTAQAQFLTTEEAAALLRLSPRTLEKQRVLGGGPRFRKFGARVVYAAEDLRSWADSRAYDMTSDPGYVQRDSVR
ncbi:Helix-turn-helix domain protein [Variovorax sp. SRS16]|uniref:helix-turn-helix transcriptional regulator n=1 Tax=Variovorax sp. SRS16 TaxID=282217 RepID=UPI001317DAE8|nr:helix-turn-helix domain-containing protein [Variovorax sp. SRS16]VTU31649.1 Helix-turn-helix domain protein [Variovorax sp. SRS16]